MPELEKAKLFSDSELDNVEVLFRLGGPPRIALPTAGHPGLFISISKT